MIKIIKPGFLKEVTCQKCGAVLSYDSQEDVKSENEKTFLTNCVEGTTRQRKYITCPQCKNKIALNAVRG